jgi:hypothetical protein
MREPTEPVSRHPHKALTARTVQSIVATGRTQRIADGDGLYLQVAPNGSKSWILRTVVKGKRCDLGLGSANLVSLAEARDEAHRLVSFSVNKDSNERPLLSIGPDTRGFDLCAHEGNDRLGVISR